ncbi:DUF6482 family protein [Marinospirillum sp.]|uniref:DUF6482 family protein n=1 Tax=Marinospirillum sp. TaxID=2183934 RepID=UPI00287077D2|nr:DUF6482 family protein [Marinospirillum sp.]MDR9468119.1 DUF6482 family protein [Marinospirillum sp.]
MQTKELKKRLQESSDLELHVVSHSGSHFYLIQIRCQNEEVDLLRGWRGQPKVYRSLEQATGELKRLGVKKAVLASNVAQDEVVGREPNYSGLTAHLPLSF